MVEPVARIRRYEPRDDKALRFTIGKAQMECLALANQQVYTNPLTLSVWVALSCVFVQFMNWWPNFEEQGYFGYLGPLPAFASMAVPLMFLCDWFNRSAFEKRTQDVLHRHDLVDLQAYYSRSPSSGLWILEYGDNFVGLLAVDASLDSTSDATVPSDGAASATKKKSTKPLSPKGTAGTATIRHFYIEEQYRAIGMQDDLLKHALARAFASETVQSIRVEDSPLQPYIGKALREQGFKVKERTGSMGVLRWQNSVRVLKRDQWQS